MRFILIRVKFESSLLSTTLRVFHKLEKLYGPHNGQRYLFTILLKDSYLFKIARTI